MALPCVDRAVEVADFETELVVLVPGKRRAHHLDPLWAVVFDSCRARQTQQHLVEEICAATGWDRTVTGAWTDTALDALRSAGVLVSPSVSDDS